MTTRLFLTIGVAAVALVAAEPGYLSVNFNQVKSGKTEAARAYLKRVEKHLDPLGAAPGTRYVRLHRVYPTGSEHGYNVLSLMFRTEPAELDPAKQDPARSLASFLKAEGRTADQHRAELDSIYISDTNAVRSRFFREVATLGKIEPGDWVRLNWIRVERGKRKAVRDSNLEYSRSVGKKHIEHGDEKAWLFYENEFPTGDADFEFLRVHVFKDSKTAQKSLPRLPAGTLSAADSAAMSLVSREAAAATVHTRIEIYQVEHVREAKP